MTRSKITTLALVAVAMFAALALAVGCSGSKTLEGYFKDNKTEWNSAVAEIQKSGGDLMTVDMSVKDNTITQIMTFTQTFSADQVAQMKTALEAQADTLKSQVGTQIKAMEKESGISGIKWHFEYKNGDGTLIYGLDVSGQ